MVMPLKAKNYDSCTSSQTTGLFLSNASNNRSFPNGTQLGKVKRSHGRSQRAPCLCAPFVYAGFEVGPVSSDGQCAKANVDNPAPARTPTKPPFGDARFGAPDIQLTAQNVPMETPLRPLSASDGPHAFNASASAVRVWQNDSCRPAPNCAAAFDSRRIPLTC
jgi:hypothetical protein